MERYPDQEASRLMDQMVSIPTQVAIPQFFQVRKKGMTVPVVPVEAEQFILRIRQQSLEPYHYSLVVEMEAIML
jgi:hypothetical protein